MTYDFSQFKSKIEEIKDWLKKELKNIQTGRATPSILDSVKAENYGVLTPINQMASIGVEDPKTLRITPFDPSTLKEIERAITNADLGLTVVVDETGIRVVFPELTTERREELVKLAKQKLESAKITLKQARDEVWSDIQEKEKNGEMTEDEKYAAKEEMEKINKEAAEELEEIFKEKEKDIMGK